MRADTRMATKFKITVKGKAIFYATFDEAEKMAKWLGFPVNNILEVQMY